MASDYHIGQCSYRIFRSWLKVPLHRAAIKKVESSLFLSRVQHGQGREKRREQTQTRGLQPQKCWDAAPEPDSNVSEAFIRWGSGWASPSSNYSRNRHPQGVEQRNLSSLHIAHMSNYRDSLGRLRQPMSACGASKQVGGININSHFI